jgi:DNA invertase Pin-like site-specific DNA recombinase
MTAKFRCAIYTRKSSEEGLDQSFNSLHAQREACEAYVLSQAGEGWSALKTLYDDGGFSGGSMERPGLTELLGDIAAGKIDVVVVYKVDRLTRSLADFAKIVEAFDRRGVSFVSVTQAFNTTSSMGRLTLNVLLWFAQFEWEVTGERIRDKIAASKAKGMWMGGAIPLGYDLRDRKLIVNPAEADIVRDIFSRYLAGASTKPWRSILSMRGFAQKHGRREAADRWAIGPSTRAPSSTSCKAGSISERSSIRITSIRVNMIQLSRGRCSTRSARRWLRRRRTATADRPAQSPVRSKAGYSTVWGSP